MRMDVDRQAAWPDFPSGPAMRSGRRQVVSIGGFSHRFLSSSSSAPKKCVKSYRPRYHARVKSVPGAWLFSPDPVVSCGLDTGFQHNHGQTPSVSPSGDPVGIRRQPIIADWLAKLNASPDPRLAAPELESQCDSIVTRLAQACRDGNVTDIDAPSFAPLREILADLSRTRALPGFSPTETATFILSLKQPLFARLRTVLAPNPNVSPPKR